MRIGKYLETALGMAGVGALLIGLVAAPVLAAELEIGEEVMSFATDTCSGSPKPCVGYTCISPPTCAGISQASRNCSCQ